MAHVRNSATGTSDKQFFDQLEEDREGWQVQQARRAVKLYKRFIERKNKPQPNAMVPAAVLWRNKINEMQAELRLKGRSPRTEKTYVGWVRRFSIFLKNKKISSLGSEDVKRYLTFLAVDTGVASATQNQAFNALFFL